MKGIGLVRAARLTRRQLVAFALVSATINGIVTASVGAWLAQTYAMHQSRRQSVESIGNLFYARRTRAGMVASSLRRAAPLEEVQHRKRAYDEAYVDWNTNIRKNLFVIREVMGQKDFARLEQGFEDDLVAALADIDRCLTKAYDERIAGRDPVPVLSACRMADVYQFALDCGATYTNELFKLSKLNFNPFAASAQKREEAEARIKKGCTRAPAPPAPPVVTSAPTTAPGAAPAAPAPGATPAATAPGATPAATAPGATPAATAPPAAQTVPSGSAPPAAAPPAPSMAPGSVSTTPPAGPATPEATPAPPVPGPQQAVPPRP